MDREWKHCRKEIFVSSLGGGGSFEGSFDHRSFVSFQKRLYIFFKESA